MPRETEDPKSTPCVTSRWSHNFSWIRILAFPVTVYLVIVLMMYWLQRSLIYLPHRENRIDVRDANLPPGQVHAITVSTDDGLELRGWHLLPDGRSAADYQACDSELSKGRHLVLYFSGNGGNRRFRTREFGLLTGLNLDVFVFDYRGYGDNPGSPSQEKLTADARSIWNYATQKRHVPPNRIIIYGESLGGGVATGLASELCQSRIVPGGLILRSTFSSLVDAGKYHYPWLPVGWMLADRFMSIDQIPQVTCPILQVHGTNDSIVPIEMGQRLFARAPEQSSSGIAKRFIKLAGAGHNDVTLVAYDRFQQEIGNFLKPP